MPADLFEAYVAGRAGGFFDVALDRPAERRGAVERACRPLAPLVLACLREQNERFGSSSARAAHLHALAEGAAAVVTGQQVGLFLGPLYTLYKTASAISVARALSAESGRPVVPVFWLQSEDHDLPEVASCAIPRAQREPLTLSVPVSADNRRSIAQLVLPSEIDACVATLESELGNLPHAREHLDRLARHYRSGAGWVDAFAGVLAELFEPEGLLLLDPRDARLASACAAVHQRALTSAPQLAGALLARCRALEQAGFSPLVHVRPDAPLNFYHPHGAEGPRYRLVPGEPDVLTEVGGAGQHALSDLLAALQREPRRFSSSALLRPILQDVLLPTAAYVAGPGELAYFAQLQPLYAAYGMSMPLVVPRARFRLLESSARRLLERLGVEPAAAQLPEAELLSRLARRAQERPQASSAAPQLELRLREGFERVLADAAQQVGPLAPQLEAALTKTREKLQTSAAKLAEKYAGLLARQDQARVEDVRRLQLLLHPHAQPQERFYGLPYFAARYGERALIERVLAAVEPFAAALKELSL